jgi:hypothetical protein
MTLNKAFPYGVRAEESGFLCVIPFSSWFPAAGKGGQIARAFDKAAIIR